MKLVVLSTTGRAAVCELAFASALVDP